MTELGEILNEAWKKGGETSLASRVQQFAYSGVDSSAIYGGLEELLLDLRAQGADDDTESHLMNVMDRLSGWCHESRVIAGRDKRAAATIGAA